MKNTASLMNTTKWNKILSFIVAHEMSVRVKLRWHDEIAGQVVNAFSDTGEPEWLDWEMLFLLTNGYYESLHLGPFTVKDIVWLELHNPDFKTLARNIKAQLTLEQSEDCVRIYGYK